MSISQKIIAETACCGWAAGHRQLSRRNGRRDTSAVLSWYSAQPRASGPSYVLTANGYVILPDGLPGQKRGLTRDY